MPNEIRRTRSLPRLRSPRRRIGLYGNSPVAHRERLIEDADRTCRGSKIAPARVWAVLLNDKQIHGRDPAIVPEPHPQATLESSSSRADPVFLGATDTQHDRSSRLPTHEHGNRHDRIGTTLRPETTAAILGDVDQILGLNREQPC